MANLVEQREARRREQRALERDQLRRGERLEQAREQVREQVREQEREEQARQDALTRARAYALEDERRRSLQDRAHQRARATRRERAAELAAERAAAQAAREAAAAARREQLAVVQAQQQSSRAQQEDREHDRRRDQWEADREADRESGRRADRESGRREAAQAVAADRGRAAAQAAARRERAQEQTHEHRRGQDREQDRAQAREQQRRGQAARAVRARSRERTRQDAREDERREQAAGRRSLDRAAERRQAQRMQERSADLRSALARNQRRDRGAARSGPAVLGALRVHGPLVLDEGDRPVRLRGVVLPGLDLQHRDRDGSVLPAVSRRELELIAAWGATLVVLPVALDALFDVPELAADLVAPLPPGAVPAHPDDLGPAPSAATADLSVLEALDATVVAAQECGLVTLVQLTRLRSEGDQRQVDFGWLRRFWQVLGACYAATPTVLFDLLRGPAGTGVNGTTLRPGGEVAARQRQHTALALLGELRRVHPGAVAVVEAPEGVVPTAALSLTDGRAAPNVIMGVRLGAAPDAVALAAVASLARTAPVLVLDWGAEAELFVSDTLGRRLAAVGAHWVAGGWPGEESLPETGRLVATAAGRAVQRALAEADPTPPVGPARR